MNLRVSRMPPNIQIILIKKINEEYPDMPDDMKKWIIQQIKGYNKLDDEKREQIFELLESMWFKDSVVMN